MQLFLWARSSNILLAQGHFLLILVDDFIRGWFAWNLSHWASKPWFRCCTFHMPKRKKLNSTLERHWGNIWFRRCTLCQPKLISTKVQQTLSNLMLLWHKTKTAIPNWFRHCSSAVLNSSVRFGTWVPSELGLSFTARSPKVWLLLIYSNSFVQI